MSRFVHDLREVSKADVARAGGKCANLGELLRAGANVPRGFVVSADAYRTFIERNGLRPQIDARLRGHDADDISALEALAAEVRGLITAKPVDGEIAAEIETAYQALEGGRVAVRSSATAEDLAEASFAGQQSTFLNVAGAAAVIDAVRACWASLFEGRAIAYRARAGFEGEVAIAVAVQDMVESEVSGIMFTVNPVTNDATQVVIEAVYGLGEAAVSGLVTPDMYIVDKATLAVIECEVSDQERELVFDPSAEGDEANAWCEVPLERRRARKLDDEQVAELARSGARLEAHFGCPQDIEWAIEGGVLHVLQARPVTTHPG